MQSPLSSESDIECMRQMLDSEASQLGCWPQLSECRPWSSLSLKSYKTCLRQKEQLPFQPATTVGEVSSVRGEGSREYGVEELGPWGSNC
jgi:hypothetical protein